jgi:hypothetical protein
LKKGRVLHREPAVPQGPRTLSLAFTSARHSTRSLQISTWPCSADKCKGVSPLKGRALQNSKQTQNPLTTFKTNTPSHVCFKKYVQGAGAVLVGSSIHVSLTLHQKLANFGVAISRRIMQWRPFTERKTNTMTLKTKAESLHRFQKHVW